MRPYTKNGECTAQTRQKRHRQVTEAGRMGRPRLQGVSSGDSAVEA
jgi:hypothetical protein